MRRVLGLHGDTPRQSTTDHSTTATNGSHPQRRRFVRDGEVPVTVIQRDHRQDDTSGANQLDAARQAIRSQAAGRERAERLLAEAQATVRSLQTAIAHERLAKDDAIERAKSERQTVEHALATVQAELAAERQARQRAEDALRDAQATVRDLQTKLGHERLAKDEAGQRAEAERRTAEQALQTARAELAAERLARHKAEDALAEALKGRQEAEQRLRDAMATRAEQRLNRGRKTVGAVPSHPVVNTAPDKTGAAFTTVPQTVRKPRTTVVTPDGDAMVKPARRRGRPPKVSQPDSNPVEWWTAGWRERFR